MQTKVCTKCGEEKFATNEYYGKQTRGKYGLRSICKECMSKSEKIRRLHDKEYHKKYHKEWCKNNKEKFKQYGINNKEHKKEYNEKNKERNAEKNKEWRLSHDRTAQNKHWNELNRDKTNGYKQKRRALKKGLLATLTEDEWINIKNDFDNKCCYCGEQAQLFQEHFIPLSKGGEYTHNNIMPSCGSCNSSKRGKNFFEWYQKYEYYSKHREIKILKYLNYKNKIQQLSILQ